MSSGEFRIIMDYLEKQDPTINVKNLINKLYSEVIPF